MRLILSLTFIFFASIVYGQNINPSKLEIINTLVVKEQKHDAIRLQVRLSGCNNELDTVYLYRFYQNTPSIPFVYDSISLNKHKRSSAGLNYLIENDSGNIVEAKEYLPPSFVHVKDAIEYSYQKEQVNKKTLKVKKVKMSYDELHVYDLSKLIKTDKDTIVDLYPLISSYHDDLAPGKYKIFLFYSFSENVSKSPPTPYLWDNNKPKETQIFKGVIVSNKVDLIIK